MDTKKMLIAGALALAGFGTLYLVGSTTGCASIDGAHGFNSLETMDDVSFARLKLFSGIGVKVAANRLIASGQVTPDDVAKAADLLASISTVPIVGTGKELVQSLLANSGLTDLEVQSLLEIVVFELEARGVLKNLTPQGTIAITPRTSEFISLLVDSLRSSVTPPTQEELKLVEKH